MKQPRILIAFLSACHKSRESHIEKTRSDMRTWSGTDYKIVFGSPDTQLPENRLLPDSEPDVLLFDCNDTREQLVLKNQSLFRWALHHDYDFVFRACDDTKVYPKRLYDHNILLEHDYAGTMCGYGTLDGYEHPFVMRYLDYMHGGVGIWLSRKAMELLVADNWKGPQSSPYGKILDILPGHAVQGWWDTYWDDLWIGEVLKGNIAYDSPERNNTYYNYLVDVYDNPQLFASNKPFDETLIIARHELRSMGRTKLHPGPFSTKYFPKSQCQVIDAQQYDFSEMPINAHEGGK